MKERVVIVGGGFGGAFAAKYLSKTLPKDVSVELLNEQNYFVFQPLLPEVASGTINAPDAVAPLRYLLPNVRLRMARVTGIDFDTRRLTYLRGSMRRPQTLTYDHLVLAPGQRTLLDLFPGFREHSICIRNLADAHELRNKVIRRLEHADITDDPDLKRRLLTFVVAGGGFSGVETIGELVEMIRRTLKFYPNIDADEVRAVLIQRDDRILPELPERLGTYAKKALTRRNVQVMCNASIQSATASAVFLEDGTRIECGLLISTVGNGPHPFTESLGLELERGKLPTDEHLRLKGFDNIWALGDAASIPLSDGPEGTPRFAPPTAQFATAEAKCLAKNIAATRSGDKLRTFDFNPKGSLASLGNYRGVAEVFGIRITGLLAWMLWRFLYIGMLPGFSTRLRVALNWMFDYLLPRSIVQIENRGGSTTDYRRYAKGDVISSRGQIPDGFYTVVEGCMESRIPDTSGGEDFVRIIGPGDHWGERTISEGLLTQGTLTATEDTRVLVMAADDFRNFCEVFPAMDDYFDGISDKIYAPTLRK